MAKENKITSSNTNKTDPHPFDRIVKHYLKVEGMKIIQENIGEELGNLISKPMEFSTVTKEADFVYEFWQKDSLGNEVLDTIFHLEAQTATDTDMLERMLLYAGLMADYYKKNGHKPKIKQIVLYLGAENNVPNEKDFGYFTYSYKLVYIKNIPYKEFLKDPNTLVFAILGKYEVADFLKVLEEIVGVAVDFHKKDFQIYLKDFLNDLEKIAELRKLQKNIKVEINRILTKKNMKTYIDELEEAAELKGELKGKLEGKLDDARAMLLDKLPVAQIVKYTGLSTEQIEAFKQELKIS